MFAEITSHFQSSTNRSGSQQQQFQAQFKEFVSLFHNYNSEALRYFRTFDQLTAHRNPYHLNVKLHKFEELLANVSTLVQSLTSGGEKTSRFYDLFEPKFLDQVYSENLDALNKLVSKSEEGKRFVREVAQCKWYNLVCMWEKSLAYIYQFVISALTWVVEQLTTAAIKIAEFFIKLFFDSTGPALVMICKFLAQSVLEFATPIVVWFLEFLMAIIPDSSVLAPFVSKLFFKFNQLVVKCVISLDSQFYFSEALVLYSYLLLRLRRHTIAFFCLFFISLFTGVIREFPSLMNAMLLVVFPVNSTETSEFRDKLRWTPFEFTT